MKEEIIKNLSGIIEYVKQGADFIKEQAPLYVQELINYGIWISVFEMILCVLGFIFGVFGIVKLVKYANNEDEFDEDLSSVVAFGFLVLSAFVLFCVVAFCFNTEHLIQAIVAPRVYVVEKLLTICK